MGIPKELRECVVNFFADLHAGTDVKTIIKFIDDEKGSRIIIEVKERGNRARTNICTLKTLSWLQLQFCCNDAGRVEFAGDFSPGEINYDGNRGSDTPGNSTGTYTVWV